MDNYEENTVDEVVDAILEHEAQVSEDHYESPMQMTGDTRMDNVVEQVTKENQLDAMMKQIEHLSSQVKLVEEENGKLRIAAEKAMKDKRRHELQSFVSSLYESGKLTDAVMTQEKLVGFAESLDSNTFDFGEEEQQPASQVLLNLLVGSPSSKLSSAKCPSMASNSKKKRTSAHTSWQHVWQLKKASHTLMLLRRAMY